MDRRQVSLNWVSFTLQRYISFSGPDFPNGVWYAASVQYGETFAVLGIESERGEVDAIYTFDGATDSWVELEGETLSEPKRSTAAFLVDHTIFPACDNFDRSTLSKYTTSCNGTSVVLL